ncbi:MAG TPA: glycosyltransferase [Pyrinomonadaceae bacterium]|nr:glycosyltransferase [Pyrinomonadaceae bacterium]
MKKRVMIFCDFYLPSFKSGGGMWTVVNLVDRFCDKYDFFIVTRNYDSKGDTKPYTTVKTDDWNKVGNATVYYVSKQTHTQKHFAKLVNEIKPDTVFLNSALSMPAVKFLSARRKKMFADIPVILAPCGEMSQGALSVKPLKKKLFLQYAKTVNLYKNIIWKASFDSEKVEIKDVMGKDSEVFVAADLVPKIILPEYSLDWKAKKEKGSVKFVFISRLVPKKNIHYFLERLVDSTVGNIEFTLVGPLEDQDYWKKCQDIIKKLPKNVKVTATGAFEHQKDALKKVAESHFFVLSTLNENFGYVFIEGLAAGCPIISSDRTVWDEIEDRNCGWRIPLEDEKAWVERINKCVDMDENEYLEMSKAARDYSIEWLDNPKFDEDMARVFDRALNDKVKTANGLK